MTVPRSTSCAAFSAIAFGWCVVPPPTPHRTTDACIISLFFPSFFSADVGRLCGSGGGCFLKPTVCHSFSLDTVLCLQADLARRANEAGNTRDGTFQFFTPSSTRSRRRPRIFQLQLNLLN